jgi:quinol monooxygenase YgiN
MFARMVECSVKPGKLQEFNLIIRNDLIFNLRKQPGFIDVINLVAETEPDHAVVVSLWRRKEDAERYQREQFPQVVNRIDHLLKGTPDVRTFHVDVSTVHKVAMAA